MYHRDADRHRCPPQNTTEHNCLENTRRSLESVTWARNVVRHSSKGSDDARGGEGISPTGGVSPCPPRTQHTGERRGGGGDTSPPRPCHRPLRARRVCGGGCWEGVGREWGGRGSVRDAGAERSSCAASTKRCGACPGGRGEGRKYLGIGGGRRRVVLAGNGGHGGGEGRVGCAARVRRRASRRSRPSGFLAVGGAGAASVVLAAANGAAGGEAMRAHVVGGRPSVA